MKTGVIIVGAGGHAKVCIEILREVGEKISFCIGGSDSPENCLDIPVLRGDEHIQILRHKGYFRAFLAIGSNSIREKLGNDCIREGYQIINAISSHAIISPSVKLGCGVAVMAGSVINAESIIEDFAIINTGATIDHDCRIGRAAHIAPQCGLAGRVSVGPQSILGIGCKVIPEIKIGEQVTVGAGSVVVRDIGSNATAVGVPAKILVK
jgi:UDP-perosamine 4-acetyltransferase